MEQNEFYDEIPHVEDHLLCNLDQNGIVMQGTSVLMGDILVGKYAPEDRLLGSIPGIQVSTSKDTCLKLPIGGRG